MAKATRLGGPSMTPEEYDNAEYVSPRITRPGVETATKRKPKKKAVSKVDEDTSTVEGGAESVGDSSKPDGSQQVENGNGETNSDPSTVPVTENPSSQEEEEPNTADSAGGTAPTTNHSGRRKPPAKKAVAPSKRAGVRSTDDMDLTF